MADNTVLNSGAGGDTVRTVAKTATGAKVQVNLIDGGGGLDASPETIWTMGLAAAAASMPVVIASDQTLPLPANAAKETGGALAAISSAAGAVADAAYAGSGSASIVAGLKGIYAKLAASIAVTGTFWQATQPVSAAALPLPAGAATAANQTNVASAPGTPQTVALTVQGNASGVALPVGQSGTWTTARSWTLGSGGDSVSAVQSGAWTVSISGNPVLGAGSATIGSVGVNNNPVGSAAFATSQAAITTTSAAAALAARTGAAGTGRASVTIYNVGGQTAYVGNSTGVTPSTGMPILPGGSYTKRTTAALFAVTASGSTTLAFDEDF